MTLIGLVVALLIVGILLWLINNYVPLDAKIKTIINVVVVIVVILWLLEVFGIVSILNQQVPRLS